MAPLEIEQLLRQQDQRVIRRTGAAGRPGRRVGVVPKFIAEATLEPEGADGQTDPAHRFSPHQGLRRNHSFSGLQLVLHDARNWEALNVLAGRGLPHV